MARLLGVNWTFFFDGGLAGQRLLGSVFQPSAFGVFLLLSVYLFLKERRAWAVASSALAAVVHPTYLLAAALLTGAYLIWCGPVQKHWKQAIGLGVLALALVAPVVVYVYGSFGQAATTQTAQTAVEARRILVEFRIPHHAQISTWFDLPSFIKIGMIAAALWIIRKQRMLFTILLTVSLGCAALTLVQILTGSHVLALIFPWRPSTLLVPLSTGLLAGAAVQRLRGLPTWVTLASLTAVSVLAGAGIFYTAHDFQQKATAPDQAMLDWILTNSQDEDAFLVPIKMENFRLETLRPMYVDFMAIPYDGADVLKWYARLLSTDRFYREQSCSRVVDFAYDGGVTISSLNKNGLSTANFSSRCTRIPITSYTGLTAESGSPSASNNFRRPL
jgi:hypothetical protein